MGIEYLACGNVMSDRIHKEDGSYSEWNMGGPAFFALAGIRLWTENCKLVCRTGRNFAETYGKWMDANHVSRESVRYELENTTAYTLEYTLGGAYKAEGHQSLEHLGYLKTNPEDIDRAASSEVKGIYLAQNTDMVFWEKLAHVKAKYGFKIMWEAEYAPKWTDMSREVFFERLHNVLPLTDMWSLNHNEASHLFDIPREEDEAIIRELQKLPVEMTFYRVGSRGSFVVTKTEAYFCPVIKPFGESVDPTGCGNNSTAAAMYAWVSGADPAMVAVMANISAGFNAAQFGTYPLYTEEDKAMAAALAKEYHPQVKKFEMKL